MSTSKKVYLVYNNSRELITLVEAVSARGVVIKLMLILLGKAHLERFYQDLSDNVLVSISNTAYINDELALDYIQHFNQQSKKTQKGAY
jgi:hypothetical protein